MPTRPVDHILQCHPTTCRPPTSPSFPLTVKTEAGVDQSYWPTAVPHSLWRQCWPVLLTFCHAFCILLQREYGTTWGLGGGSEPQLFHPNKSVSTCDTTRPSPAHPDFTQTLPHGHDSPWLSWPRCVLFSADQRRPRGRRFPADDSACCVAPARGLARCSTPDTAGLLLHSSSSGTITHSIIIFIITTITTTIIMTQQSAAEMCERWNDTT